MSKLSDRRKEIREYTVYEAEQELARLRRQLFDLRIQQQRGEVKNNRQFTQVRTDVARVLYQLTLLELAEEDEAAAVEEEIEEEEEAAEVRAKASAAQIEKKAARPAELSPAEEAGEEEAEEAEEAEEEAEAAEEAEEAEEAEAEEKS